MGNVGSTELHIRLAPDIWGFCKDIAPSFSVSPVVHQDDFMLDFTIRAAGDRREGVLSYFKSGDDAAVAISGMVRHQLGFRAGRILEFASGYGRVSRHLAKYFTEFEIDCCDIHEQGVALTQQALGLRSFLSTHAPEELRLPESYDVIFAISFFSHMPPESFGRWLARLCTATKPGGFVIFTTHGRHAMKRSAADSAVVDLFERNTFLYDLESEQRDLDLREYGAMFVTPEFVANEVRSRVGAVELSHAERGWASYQDLYVLALPQA